MTIPEVRCFKVKLKTSDTLRKSARLFDGRYVKVDDGYLFVVHQNISLVADLFPNALSIEDMGLAIRPQDFSLI